MKKYIPVIVMSCCALATATWDSPANAQESKNVKRSVLISNGDTIVNGKSFNEIDKDERAKLREEFKEMSKSFKSYPRNPKEESVTIKRRVPGVKGIPGSPERAPNVLYWNNRPDEDIKIDLRAVDPGNIRMFKFDGDSSLSFSFNADSIIRNFNFRMDGLDSNLKNRIITMNRNFARPGTPVRPRVEGRNIPWTYEFNETMPYPGYGERTNSSSFNYNYTDKDGISSRMNIRVSDASKEQVKKITGAETITKPLDVTDLTLFPSFSSGKMTLSFNTLSKGLTNVAILNGDMKQIFSDNVAGFSGNYIKQLPLPQNGIYYITVNQGGNWFIKRIIKN